jgi:hypothetical protein
MLVSSKIMYGSSLLTIVVSIIDPITLKGMLIFSCLTTVVGSFFYSLF